MKNKGIIGIDLAGNSENPTGWALLESRVVKTSLIYTDNEILQGIMHGKPTIIAIDAPFSLPKRGILRKADKEMIKKRISCFPTEPSSHEKANITHHKAKQVDRRKRL